MAEPESVDNTPMETTEDLQDFFNEAKDIEESKEETEEVPEEDSSTKTPDEGEQEMKWLQDAGYGYLVPRIEEAGEINADIISAEMSSLTRNQAAAVIRRVNTLHQTFKRKRRDVRSVFSDDGEEEEESCGVVLKDGLLAPSSDRWKSSTRVHKNRGEYDMSGIGEDVDGVGSTDSEVKEESAGIETLSIQTVPASANMRNVKEPGPDVESIDCKLDDGLFPTSKLTFSDVKNQTTDPTDGLPNFVLVRDKFGITRITDIAALDLQRVRSLALIELTALYDSYGISLSTKKVKKKYNDTGQFGVPLQTVVDNERRAGRKVRVPTVLSKIIEYLDTYCLKEEGILRVPGSAVRIKNLRQNMEDNATGFVWADMNHNDVAALLKQYLRDLPVPILTHEYIESFAQVEKIADKKQQLQALNLLIILLPDVHRDSLKLLLRCLDRIVEHRELNKMNISNVAMIIAPNLFLVNQASNRKVVKEIEFNMAAGTSNIVKMLIKYQDILWTIPSFLVTQIRHQYESEQMRHKSKDKSLMKFIKKEKTEPLKKPPILNEADFQSGLMRVQATHQGKSTTAVQLEEKTTAADIVDKFKQQKNNVEQGTPDGSRNPSSIYYAEGRSRLFEIGGNIGERCMDPGANMLEAYRVNPNAEWVIKDMDATVVC